MIDNKPTKELKWKCKASQFIQKKADDEKNGNKEKEQMRKIENKIAR